jgi:hypothetical protein
MLRQFGDHIDANRAFIPNYRAIEEGRVSRSTTRKGKIVSALLEKLAGYIVEPDTPDKDLREKAVGIVLKGGFAFSRVVVDGLDADTKVVSVRDLDERERQCHILVDEIAAVLAPKAERHLVTSVAQ